jgi:Uma2 family endonuclease
MGVAILARPPRRRRHKPRPELLTFEQFCDLIHEDQKADLIKGVMYMQSPPSILHEIVFGFLHTILNIFVCRKKLGAEFGVREYWMIDPNRQTAEFLRNLQGKWESIPLGREGIFHSLVVPGFWLRVDWLWAEELPDPLETVMQILNLTVPDA